MVYTRITIIRSVVYIFYYMYEGTVRRYRCTWTRAEYRVPGTRTVFEVFFFKKSFLPVGDYFSCYICFTFA
jgi:hypothetical protein